MVMRYTMVVRQRHPRRYADIRAVPSEDGRYVEYSDYATLNAKLATAKFEIERLRAELKEFTRMINP